MQLLAHLGSCMARHAVNEAVSARCKSTPEAFKKYVETCNDENFAAKCAAARANPKSKEAKQARHVDGCCCARARATWTAVVVLARALVVVLPAPASRVPRHARAGRR